MYLSKEKKLNLYNSTNRNVSIEMNDRIFEHVLSKQAFVLCFLFLSWTCGTACILYTSTIMYIKIQ